MKRKKSQKGKALELHMNFFPIPELCMPTAVSKKCRIKQQLDAENAKQRFELLPITWVTGIDT